MNYNHSAKNDSTMTTVVMCAVVFVAFSFLWLYYFQADVISVTQHVLSHGHTHYNRLVGAVLITLLLWLLQAGVYNLMRLRKYAHALTYFPSVVLLALLSSASASGGHLRFSTAATILIPVFLAAWIAAVWTARTVQTYEGGTPAGPFSRRLWVNMLTMALMFVGVTAFSNTDAVYHYRAHIETALAEGSTREALRVGSRSHETDASLMMLRMYALSRCGLLGDRLFAYPVVATSSAMLPTGADSQAHLLKYPADSIYRHLGAIPRHSMSPMDYLGALVRNRQARRPAYDYLLCGYLLDKDLDAFARCVVSYYPLATTTTDVPAEPSTMEAVTADSLPLHYREALVLYTHLRSQPVVVYHDPVLDTDYEDFLRLEQDYPTESERRGKVMESYANSYWYYYNYATRP